MVEKIERQKLINSAINIFSFIADILDYPDSDTIDTYKKLIELNNEFFKEERIANCELLELEQEYIKLFVADIGGVKAPPYASFYTEKRLMGKAATEFLSLLEASGYMLNKDIVSGPPDHVSLQLGFLSRLMEDSNFELACIVIDRYLNWLGQFAEAVKKNSSIVFYNIVVSIMLNFIDITKEVICHKDQMRLKDPL